VSKLCSSFNKSFEDTMSSSSSTTVRFNVGGTKYEVATSTVLSHPDTMLARLVSERWNGKNGKRPREEDDQDEIFIDSDGKRFHFVLDFMRHKRVFLPKSVSKAAVLQDLKFFGFQDVPAYAICVAGDQMLQYQEKHTAKVQKMREEIKKKQDEVAEMKLLADFTEFSFRVFCKYMTSDSQTSTRSITFLLPKKMRYSFSSNTTMGYIIDKGASSVAEDDLKSCVGSLEMDAKAKLGKCLVEYGFRYVEHFTDLNGAIKVTVETI
jgi:BTB/POZ domain